MIAKAASLKACPTAASLPARGKSLIIAIAKGEKKHPGIAGAIKRRIINGLITDELTAKTLLAE